MEFGAKRLDLLQQPVDQFLGAHDGKRRNVIDRFFRVQLRALATWLLQRVDDVRFDIEQSKFKDLEQADRAGSYDDDVSGNGHGKCSRVNCDGSVSWDEFY